MSATQAEVIDEIHKNALQILRSLNSLGPVRDEVDELKLQVAWLEFKVACIEKSLKISPPPQS